MFPRCPRRTMSMLWMTMMMAVLTLFLLLPRSTHASSCDPMASSSSSKGVTVSSRPSAGSNDNSNGNSNITAACVLQSADLSLKLVKPTEEHPCAPQEDGLQSTLKSKKTAETPAVKAPKKSRRRKKAAFVTTTKTKQSSSKKRAATPEEAASLRRIQSEWRDMVDAGMAYNWKLHKPVLTKGVESPTPHHLWVGPLSKNLWVWHFSFMGLEGTAFESGIYHGRILLPKNYPAHPPRVQVFTPTGRFVPRADICLSASHFHPETWTATWTIRTLIESLRLHMLTAANEIGGMEATREQRQHWAVDSRQWSTDLTRSIRVNHADMIAQGLFPTSSKNADNNMETTTERDVEEVISTVPISFRDQGVEWQQVERPFVGIAALLRSPIKVALLSLCLLFVILNSN